MTVSGRTLGENIDGAVVYNDDVIATREAPLGRKAASPCCAAICA